MDIHHRVGLFDLYEVPEVDSTNLFLKEKAFEGLKSFSAVRALRQRVGYGRQGRTWVSLEGNLFLSCLLRTEEMPKIEENQTGQLSFLVSLALLNAFETLAGPQNELALKWPNDLLYKNGKLAGILLEKHEDILIIGVGANLTLETESQPLKGGAFPPKAFPFVNASELAVAFLAQFSVLFEDWQHRGFSMIRQGWLARARGLEEKIIVRLPNEQFEGIFKGIDPYGALEVQTDKALRFIHAGEVFFGEKL